jgi:hypothetical protein
MTYTTLTQLIALQDEQLRHVLALIDALLPVLHRRGGNVTGELDASLRLLKEAGVLDEGTVADAPHLSADLLYTRKLVAYELARRLISQARWLEVRDVLEGARSVLRRSDDRLAHADVLHVLGRVDALLGYVERGRERLREAAATYEALAYVEAAARCEMSLHRLQRQHDAPEATLEQFADPRQVYANLDDAQTQTAIIELADLLGEAMAR